MIREDIYQALFAKFLPYSSMFPTMSRRLRHFNDVPANAQPALFLMSGNQGIEIVTGKPPRWVLEAEVYVYCRTDGAQIPGQVIFPLIDKLAEALGPDDPLTNSLRLGGLVEYCRFEGSVQIHEGVLGDQAIIIMPIRMRQQGFT